MGKKRLSYSEVVEIFNSRGLQLDTSELEFNAMNLKEQKLQCHCIKHPDIPLEYYCGVVKSGRFGCKECRKERAINQQRMTSDEKLQFIKDRGYTYVSGDVTKILNRLQLICPNGHECFASINDLMRNACVCNICNGRVPAGYWTINTCQEWIDHESVFAGYRVLDVVGDRVLMKCPIESHKEYWTSWQHVFREKTLCRACYYTQECKIDWTLDNAKDILRKHGYEMIDESLYVSSHHRIPCRDMYGFIYMVSVHYLQQGRTKFALWKNNPYAVHNINLYCKLFRPDYEFVSQEYYGSKEVHKWRYIGDSIDDTIYDREFEVCFGYFVNSQCGHPELSRSKLESKCKLLLDKYGLNYKTQKTFDGCVDKIKLRFDFYLLLNDEEICIETDGSQHQYPVEKFGGLEGLAKRQKHDAIKNQYCIDNNIRLIRIPESKFKKMEEILIKELHLDTQALLGV